MRNVASLTLVVGCFLAMLTITPSAAQAAGGAKMNSYERAVVRAISHQRTARGIGGIRGDRALARAANYHTVQMLRSNFFSHSSRNGTPFHSRVRRFAHRRAVGETLALVGGSCRGTAGRIVRMWMNSPGHRAILLSGGYRRVGIGARVGNLGRGRTCVVTADFASRR